MSEFINTAFNQQYTTNVALLLQQKGSRLADKVMRETAVGKSAKFLDCSVPRGNWSKRPMTQADYDDCPPSWRALPSRISRMQSTCSRWRRLLARIVATRNCWPN